MLNGLNIGSISNSNAIIGGLFVRPAAMLAWFAMTLQPLGIALAGMLPREAANELYHGTNAPIDGLASSFVNVVGRIADGNNGVGLVVGRKSAG